MPPLRERLVDLVDICSAVIERIAGDAGVTPVPELTAGAMEHLRRYSFPGNVRELENLLHRALALAGGSRIERQDLALPDDVLVDADAEPAPATAQPAAPQAATGAAQLPSDLVVYLDQVERDILERALERHRYNRTAAGASLGLSLRQMRYRMARLGIGSSDGTVDRGDGP